MNIFRHISKDKYKDQLVTTLDSAVTIEEKAAHFYSFFTSKKASKADFAQRLAYNLCKNSSMTPDELQEAIPPYLYQAIKYVVGS